MLERDVLRAVAACAPGKRVTVLVPPGTIFELPIVPSAPAPEPPHPLEAAAAQLLERDAETRATLAEAAARAEETLATVRGMASTIAEGQERIVASIDENTRTLNLPVKPAYFPDGKLRHAQRVEKG